MLLSGKTPLLRVCLTSVVIICVVCMPALAHAATVSVMLPFADSELELIEEFMEELYRSTYHEDVEIEVISGNLITSIQQVLSGQQHVDVVAVPDQLVYQFRERGILAPLDAYLLFDPVYHAGEQANNSLLVLYQSRGSTYGLPFLPTTSTLLINRKLLDQVGLASAIDSWTLDDLLALAKLGVEDTNRDGHPDRYGLVVPLARDTMSPALGLVWCMGGSLQSVEEEMDESPFMDDDGIRRALEWFHEWGKENSRAGTVGVVDSPLGSEAFYRGDAIALIVGGFARKPETLDVVFMPLPLSDNQSAQRYVTSLCLSMTSTSKDPEIAWRVVKLLHGPDFERLLLSVSFLIPQWESNISLVGQMWGEDAQSAFEAVVSEPVGGFPSGPNSLQQLGLILTAVERAVAGQLDVDEIMSRLVYELRQLH